MSVRLMARQLINESISVQLPEYSGQVDEDIDDYPYHITIPYSVTPPRLLMLHQVEIEKMIQGSPVDIYGTIEDYSFILYFTHPGREVPEELRNPEDERCGIVSVSLAPTYALFADAKQTKESYKEILYSFLKNEIYSKTWIFHPRQKIAMQLAKKKLQNQINTIVEKRNAAIIKRRATESSSRSRQTHNSVNEGTNITQSEYGSDLDIEALRVLVNYECLICHTQWQGYEPGNSVCPKCKTHLFRSNKGCVQE